MAEEFNLEGPILIDLTEIKDEPVAEGYHLVQIERVDPGYSSQQKIPQLFVMSRIVDEADPEFNRTVIWNSQLQGEGLIFTKRFFAAVGLEDVVQYPSIQGLVDDLLEAVVEVRVRHRTYEGRVQANVSNWRPYQPEAEVELAF